MKESTKNKFVRHFRQNNPEVLETTGLYYKKFPYRVCLKQHDQTYQFVFDCRPIIYNELIDFHSLKNNRDYRFREDKGQLKIYIKDKDNFESISKVIEEKGLVVTEINIPDEDYEHFLRKDPNLTIVSKTPDFPFQCVLKESARGHELQKVVNWAKENPDKVSMDSFLQFLIKDKGRPGFRIRSFYVKDEKHLNVARLIADGSIAQVKSYLSKEYLDKYEYAIEQ